MFRKPFKVKSNNAIRGSERRKLKDHVKQSFPSMLPEDVSLLVPNKEPMSVMNISTYNETSVTCYFLQKVPILFETEGVFLPTVYTLWKYPQMILSFKTSPNVFSILSGGADLMFPGVLQPPSGFPDFNAQSACFVTLVGNGAAVAVGVTSCSKDEITQDGCTGKRVTIHHCYKDYLWAAGEKDSLPTLPDFMCMAPPTEEGELSDELLEGKDIDEINKEECISDGMNNLNVSDMNQNGNVDADVVADQDLEESSNATIEEKAEGDAIIEEDNVEEKPILTPQEEMDLLLRNCFYQALLDAKKVELPILVSKFSSVYLHGACPTGQRIDVKKSTYKKMSKFLAEMQSNGLIVVKELSKGVESIISMDIQNEIMAEYATSDFAKDRKVCKKEKLEEEKQIQKEMNKTVEVRDLYAVSAKNAPFFKLFGINKGVPLSSAEVRQLVTEYVKEHELVNQNNKKLINMDALLTDTLFSKGKYEDFLTWDGIMTRMLENMNPCHEITCPGKDPIMKKGKMEYIEVSIENRMGNKKVTVIKNLESFGIDTKVFAQSLQQACASSTAVNPMPGKNASGHLVIAQGSQTKHVKALLETFKVPLKYAKGLQSKK